MSQRDEANPVEGGRLPRGLDSRTGSKRYNCALTGGICTSSLTPQYIGYHSICLFSIYRGTIITLLHQNHHCQCGQ
jgi:hypothetical protein